MHSAFNLSGYGDLVYHSRDMYSKINKNCGGGVGIYLREGLNYELLEKKSIFIKGLYESIWLLVKLPKGKNVILGNIYRPNTPPLANIHQATIIHKNILESIKKD